MKTTNEHLLTTFRRQEQGTRQHRQLPRSAATTARRLALLEFLAPQSPPVDTLPLSRSALVRILDEALQVSHPGLMNPRAPSTSRRPTALSLRLTPPMDHHPTVTALTRVATETTNAASTSTAEQNGPASSEMEATFMMESGSESEPESH